MTESRNLLIVLGEWWEQRRAARGQVVEPANPAGTLRRFLRWMAPNGGTLLLILVLILTQRVWARPLLAAVNAPGPSATTVNYQGRLADPAGNPLDGNYGMTFSLWDSASGGTMVWGPENHTAVPVSNGLFSVGLGSQTSGGIPTTVWDGDRYLEITVGGETLSPRELLRSVPIAGMALTVPDGAIGSRQMRPTIFQVQLNEDVEVPPGGPQVLLELTVDFPTDATYVFFIALTSRHDAAGYRVEAGLQDSSGNNIGWLIHNSHPVAGSEGTQTGALMVVHDLGAGPHTLRLVAWSSSTVSSGYARAGTQIIAIPYAQVP